MSDKELSDFRLEIDDLDDQLVALLARRMDIVRHVAVYKHHNNIPAVLPERIEEVCKNVIEAGEMLGLNKTYVKDIWTRIIDEACAYEQEFFDEN